MAIVKGQCGGCQMEICGDSLDEILVKLYRQMLSTGGMNVGTRGSIAHEFLGVSIRLSRPRSRLSLSENRGRPFSALAEFFWYLAGSGDLDFIRSYIPDYEKESTNGTIPGAYGPRIFNMRSNIDQLDNVVKLLEWKSNSKRAVIQLFNAEDINLNYAATSESDFHYPETPCTISLQFHIREGKLHLSANMRSNDAFKGFPHDVFCFTMLQEMMARRLKVELGDYLHYAGSMHIYQDDISEINGYLYEGHHKVVEMPEMPSGNPFDLAESLVRTEGRIRAGEQIDVAEIFSDKYWADLVRLIQAFWASGNNDQLDMIKSNIAPAFRIFVEGRREKTRRCPAPRQMKFRGRDA